MRAGSARRKKGKGKRKGGWQETKWLEWSDVKKIKLIAHAARRAGKALNVFMTIRAPVNVSDAEGKRLIAKIVGHFGEALKRRGQEHIGITPYEKAPHLHAHYLVHVDPENDDVVARYANGEDVYARPAVPSDIGYITKQRRHLSPEFEADIRKQGMRYEKSGGPIPGPRWTATKSAKVLIEARLASIQPTRTQEHPAAAVPIPPTTNAVQLELFPDLPTIIPFGSGEDVRALREKTGMTQRRLADRLGLRNRASIAHVERGHDRLSRQRRRRLHFLFDAERSAA